MCHIHPSIWHTIRPGLWWTVKPRQFRRNCSARSALLKSHKLGSQKHTYALERSCPQVWVKQRAHILYAHSPLTPAGVLLRLDGIMPTARGYYSCPMPESVTNTQNQEVFFFCSTGNHVTLSVSDSSSSPSLQPPSLVHEQLHCGHLPAHRHPSSHLLPLWPPTDWRDTCQFSSVSAAG